MRNRREKSCTERIGALQQLDLHAFTAQAHPFDHKGGLVEKSPEESHLRI